MFKHYLKTLVGCTLIATTAFGQGGSPSPENVPTPVLRQNKSVVPFLGLTGSLPLRKIFGKKRVKALPEPPSQLELQDGKSLEELGLTEAFSSTTIDGGTLPIEPRIPGHQPKEDDGGGGTPSSPPPPDPTPDPNPGRPPGGDGGSEGGNTGGGGYVEPPLSEADECQKCKQDANAYLEVEKIKLVQAEFKFDIDVAAAERRANTEAGRCGVEALGLGLLVFSGGKWLMVTGWGAVAVGAAVIIVGGLYDWTCVRAATADADKAMYEARSSLDNAKAAFNSAQAEYARRIIACGCR